MAKRQIHVRDYTKKDGTNVRDHDRNIDKVPEREMYEKPKAMSQFKDSKATGKYTEVKGKNADGTENSMYVLSEKKKPRAGDKCWNCGKIIKNPKNHYPIKSTIFCKEEKTCAHSERVGDYCEHCETGETSDEVYIGYEPKNGWYLNYGQARINYKFRETREEAKKDLNKYKKSHNLKKETMSEHDAWLGEIYDIIEQDLEVTRSDAQGIVDAQEFLLAQSWGKGLNAKETAKLIDKASRHN